LREASVNGFCFSDWGRAVSGCGWVDSGGVGSGSGGFVSWDCSFSGSGGEDVGFFFSDFFVLMLTSFNIYCQHDCVVKMIIRKSFFEIKFLKQWPLYK
jgi:hypothetical protein